MEFDADQEKRDAVVASGDAAARAFLRDWSWKRFKKECRGVEGE